MTPEHETLTLLGRFQAPEKVHRRYFLGLEGADYGREAVSSSTEPSLC